MLPHAAEPLLVAEAVETATAAIPVHRLLLLFALVVAVGTLLSESRPARLVDPLKRRFVGGVPWGTLISCWLIVVVYYGLQGGLDTPNDPVVVSFRAWSYFDPFGMLLAGFSHASVGHLTGNLLGTLVFGSLAEYWWGHYTERRTDSLRHRVWTKPAARAVLIFPAATILVGIGGTLVALGPVIGFSMVVFAFAGFGLVRYPLVVVIASVGQGVLSRLLNAVLVPQQVAVAESTFSTPWFASIAVQGHLIGLLIGVLLGVGMLRLRNEPAPPALHIWLGVLFFGVSRSLWAIYWFRGDDVYVLYRALGFMLVLFVVAIVTYSVVARDEPMVPSQAVDNPTTITDTLDSLTHRQFGLLLLVSTAAIVAGPAIPVNLTTAGDAELPGTPIEVDGYEITYGEDVPDGQLSVIPLEAFGESTQLNTSGVIVRNSDRHIWATVTSTGRLAASGEARVRLGGLDWQETVHVDREGWQTAGGQTAYQVALSHDSQRQTVFASEPAAAEPVVAGHRISINATKSTFLVAVEPVRTANATAAGNATDADGPTNDPLTESNPGTTTNETDTGTTIVLSNVPTESATVDSARIPAPNESVTVGPIRFVNRDDRLFAVHRGTVVRVAQRT